jgi:hypothetical protein
MNRKTPIWIGCFLVAVMLVLSTSHPVQLSEAKYKDNVNMDFVEVCDDSNCANTAVAPLSIFH